MDGLETQIPSDCRETVRGRVVYKMTGSGNDFVMVDGRTGPASEWTPEQIRKVCDRRDGLGADGLAVLEPGDESGHVRFHFFNNDGNRTEMCGNASLCATRLAVRLELAQPDGMVLDTDAGPIETRVLPGPGERAEIGLPQVMWCDAPDIPLLPGELSLHLVTVGVPHLAIQVDEILETRWDILPRGRELRAHPDLPDGGANVNFVWLADGKWKMRTYERGVEAETPACGTGAVAVAATLACDERITLPWKVETASGKILEVSGTLTHARNQALANARLAGEGRAIFRAVLD